MKFLVLILAFVVTSVFSSDLPAEFIHQPVELEDAHIVKRQATQPPAPKKEETTDYTSVRTKGGCKLYAANVTFFKKTQGTEQGKYETLEIQLPGTALKSINDGTCGTGGGRNGTIILDYTEGPFKPIKGSGQLTELKLTFNITYRRAFGWWELSELAVVATGDFVEKGNFSQTFNGSVMRSMAIGASKNFSYACGQPPTIYYSMDEKKTTVYGLKFKNLQIQPFEWRKSAGNFTNDVDDCVPFFSIGIWMFLIVAAVLLLVIFFGIGMISSLKTMDRFDDPKGKPLVISAKE